MNDRTRSKAEFRASRETLGLSQGNVARLLGIDVANVKRWEKPGEAYPKPFAWELLDELMKLRRKTIAEGVEVVLSMQEHDGMPDRVQLTYWRDQAQFDAMGRDEGPFGMANANARGVAAELERLGIDVEWSYADDDDNVYHVSARSNVGE